ncbi:dynein axonemal assembly factor 9 isoform X1 [Paramormyrops kingsleyae]|uniref:dynein axonemal assembly factor 9 isoform X1 n=1 Tax=Paramormyrops kingsleyae TaxID=1676925 RepID=UPI000CD5E5E3|nr:uncharacterized protein C20orf194 homolog isoform X1 [Paramormyrops kingsleyae]
MFGLTKMAGIRNKNGIHQVTPSAVSSLRLRHIQSILRDSGKSIPDGILCSLGIDSRYNLGCSELANYLFFDLYKQNHLDLNFSEFLEELLDDVILLIKADSVHLYCNPVNYTSLLPYISHWRNLHIHCMTEAEYEDEEAAEEFKISSFVKMVQDCSHIGVPYSSQGHVQKFDMFLVEKWPIIQAYALEGIGGGGFFTTKHKLIDMSEKLWQTYSRMDPISLDILLTEDLVTFEKQWTSFFSNFAIESYSTILELSEAQAGEPFRTYFSHGLISRQITSNSRQPFVLFGGHSTREHMDSYCFSFPSESHQVRNTGPQGTAAKHMVVQCVSPEGPLACARTYFFGTTHTPYLGNGSKSHKRTEITLLSELYSTMVQAVLTGIRCYCNTFSTTKAWDAAEQSFQLSLDAHGLTQYKSSLLSKTIFNIQAVNNEGRVIPLESVESRFMVKTAFMAVYDIPHPLEGREVLGSLVFSESFLESCLYVQEQDGSVSRDSHFTILTADIPRYVSWLVDECDVKLSECVQQLLKQEEETCLGVVLSAGDTALMSSSDLLTTAEEGKISFFSEGILFVHPQYGSVTLPRNLICGLKFYQGDSSRTLAALFLECKSSILPFLPFQLRSASHSLAFGLQAKSNSYRSFCAQVLPVWLRQKCDVGQIVQTVSRDQLTPEQKIMLCRLDRLCKSHAPLTTLPSGSLKVSSTAPPELEAFLQHFALSSLGQEVVQRNHLEVLFSRRETPPHQHARDCKIVMTILTGIPGSCKDNLCNFLMNLNKSYGRWMVYRPPLDRHEVFCRAHFQRYLSSLLESQMNTGLSPSKCRLLVLTPGYTDVADVVQAALAHPDPVIRDAFSLGAITACVDPLSSFMEHRYAFPKLLEQCSHGLVSNVVFTGLTQEQRHPLLKQVQQLVRAANPGAAFILAEKGAVTRNEDVELILSESSFSEPLMLTARYLLYPGLNMGKFCSGDMSPTMNHHCVTFSRPLDRLQFMARCKELKPLRPDPFCGNIYHICGRVKFSDSDKLMELSFGSVSGTLSMVPAMEDSSLPTHICSLQFYGVDLTMEGLKDWLRQCTPQKAARKALKTRKTLTPQEIRIIHVSRHLHPLPVGYFYNGSQYVTFFGEKMTFHPLMEEFIDEYLEEANKEIERFNHQLEQQCQGDLFDP